MEGIDEGLVLEFEAADVTAELVGAFELDPALELEAALVLEAALGLELGLDPGELLGDLEVGALEGALDVGVASPLSSKQHSIGTTAAIETLKWKQSI